MAYAFYFKDYFHNIKKFSIFTLFNLKITNQIMSASSRMFLNIQVEEVTKETEENQNAFIEHNGILPDKTKTDEEYPDFVEIF
jgi:hypothetical protein